MSRVHWNRLPAVAGFTRVTDDRSDPENPRRMLRCDGCGLIIPSFGVGYHKQNNWRKCKERQAAGGWLPGDPPKPEARKAAATVPAAPTPVPVPGRGVQGEHAVFGFDGTGRVRLSAWLPWREAIQRWEYLDARGVDGVLWFAVREATDPEWNAAEFREAG